ncbi:MAG: hypothetical protein K8L99_24240, partial [Anaerolineae bacterium]|nr:hypothetical protein [Anaerolineae bacterium]
MDIKIDSPSRERPDSQGTSSLWVIAAAWGVMLVASILPDIILQESGAATDWLLWGKLGIVGLLIASTFVWKALQPLRGYLLILAALLVAGWGIGWLADSAVWRDWFRGTDFTSTMLEGQIQKLILTLVVIGVLLVLKRHPR